MVQGEKKMTEKPLNTVNYLIQRQKDGKIKDQQISELIYEYNIWFIFWDKRKTNSKIY